MATSSNTNPPRLWRALIAAGGIAVFVGGGMHPDTTIKEGLAERLGGMIVGNEGTWIVGHGLMTLGTALLLAGLVLARKADVWPSASRALAIAIPATAFSVVDLTLHTLDVIDGDELAGGSIPLLTLVHLTVALLAGVVFGLALTYLAWTLGRAWGGPRLLIAALGIVAGVANVFAVPVVLTTDSNVLFPIAGLGMAFWAVGTGLAGATAVERATSVQARAA